MDMSIVALIVLCRLINTEFSNDRIGLERSTANKVQDYGREYRQAYRRRGYSQMLEYNAIYIKKYTRQKHFDIILLYRRWFFTLRSSHGGKINGLAVSASHTSFGLWHYSKNHSFGRHYVQIPIRSDFYIGDSTKTFTKDYLT
jgi:hypothetical protein